MRYTVFDVARELLRRAPKESLNTVKLQKLSFYVFGWYAHQTGQGIFPEPFYAMDKGPVVGELLSAHAGKRSVTAVELVPQFEVREESPAGLDLYLESIIEGVWGYYGKYDPWQLVEMTHEESIWVDAWKSRADQSKRADLKQAEVISYFLHEKQIPAGLDLPDAKVTIESMEQLEEIETGSTRAPDSFVKELRKLLATSSK